MKYIFWGSPEFAAIVLRKLIQCSLPPTAIVCNPDRPQGRHQALTSPEVKSLREVQLPTTPLFQPENVKDIVHELEKLAPDIFVVAAYGKIIPESVLKIPKFGSIGVHPSLLPQYRGASPIQSAILNGDTVSGVSLYRLTAKMDDGAVYVQKQININPDDNSESLMRRLGEAGGELLCGLLKDFPESLDEPKPQDESAATYTKKFKNQDAFVPSAELKAALGGDAPLAQKIFNMLRALNPEPGVWTLNQDVFLSLPADKRVKLLTARLEGGELIVDEVQIEGGRPQKVSR